ncbi:unnamed protein product [Closterium sp. Yama58-4]|nr:unnamed protein product [Closterium sp. Yama58-4]
MASATVSSRVRWSPIQLPQLHASRVKHTVRVFMPKPETRSLSIAEVGGNEKIKQRIIGVRLDSTKIRVSHTRIFSKHNPETGETEQGDLPAASDPASPAGSASGTVLGSVLDSDPSQRRSVQVTFTCGACGARTSRLANPLALKKGTVFVQCGGCEKFHRLVDNLGLIVEYDFRNESGIMDFELRRAQQRYEKEQREKREAARVKAERQRKAKEEIEARRRAIEEAQRLKRLEEAAAAETARRQLEADLQAGGGIRFNRELIPVAIAGDRDKITLPQSVLSDLPLEEALDRGPMLFELSVPRAVGGSAAGGSATGGSAIGGSTAGGMEVDWEEEDDADEGDSAVDVDINGGDYNGRRVKRRVTHGGVLEFTAPEGCVGLPPLILRNLGLSGIIDVFNPSGSPPPVRVRFVKLPKATFARLQPLRHGFLADVANHRAVLEAALRGQAALTRGDVLLVGSELGEVAVRVCEVKGVGGASGAATVIDADVEIELSPLGRRLYLGEVELEFRLQLEGGSAELAADVARGGADVAEEDADLFNLSAHSKELISSDLDPSTSAAAAAAAAAGGGGGGDAAAAVPPTDQSRCANCRQLIATRTLPLHEAYCSRHNVVCPHPGCSVVLRRADLESGGEHHQHCGECGEVFGGRREREKHERVLHGEMVCECGLMGKAAEVVSVTL